MQFGLKFIKKRIARSHMLRDIKNEGKAMEFGNYIPCVKIFKTLPT